MANLALMLRAARAQRLEMAAVASDRRMDYLARLTPLWEPRDALRAVRVLPAFRLVAMTILHRFPSLSEEQKIPI